MCACTRVCGYVYARRWRLIFQRWLWVTPCRCWELNSEWALSTTELCLWPHQVIFHWLNRCKEFYSKWLMDVFNTFIAAVTKWKKGNLQKEEVVLAYGSDFIIHHGQGVTEAASVCGWWKDAQRGEHGCSAGFLWFLFFSCGPGYFYPWKLLPTSRVGLS